MRRSVPALIAIALVAGAALTGCSGSSVASASCAVKSGSGSDSVTATGKFGADPKAKVPAPMNASTTQATTLITGKGSRVVPGGVARLALTVFDGESGSQTQQTQVGYFPIVASQITKGLMQALECTQQGSRIAVVIPPKDGASSFGVSGSAVAVVDVEQVLPSRATGRPVPATPGFPTVILAPNGQPGIVIGSNAAPTTVKSALLRQGDGAKAAKTDTLVVQTQTVEWSDPSSATGSWEQKSPATQSLNDGSVIASQLIGKRVGSQVVILTPASKSSDGSASVTVVDILGILPSSGQ